jgi:hypothetical protein
LCGAQSELKLRQIMARLQSLGFLCRPFFEPDLTGQLTAFATGPVRGEQRRCLRRYQCLAVENSPAGDPAPEPTTDRAALCENHPIKNNSLPTEA